MLIIKEIKERIIKQFYKIKLKLVELKNMYDSDIESRNLIEKI